ncbi:MAG: arylsulfotransferase family protein [Pseudomonadales bacterium]|nr:arylsulfotransferase family protein [Pseudomonadales bacterium]
MYISRRNNNTFHNIKVAIIVFLLNGITACDKIERYDVSVYKAEKVWDSYTLPSSALGGYTPVIDMEGNVITHYDCGGNPIKLLPNSTVLCYASKIGGFVQKTLRQLSTDGEILWEFNDWDRDSARQHHDFQFAGGNPVGYYVPGMDMIGPSEGGSMLVLSYLTHKHSEQDIRKGRLIDSVLYEIDATGNILWQWHAIDHIDGMGFSESALKDLERGILESDWLHVNTASYIGPNKWFSEFGDERFHPDNLMIASPFARWVAIIDKITGNIVWRLGPDYSPGNPGAEFNGLNFSHAAHIIPEGLPGAGNLLVFDNGRASGYGDQHASGRRSRTLEINPIDYSIAWKYDHPRRSPIMGNVQRLPNGNTFITEGVSGVMLEVTPEKEVVWQARGWPLYRAYRIPKDWVETTQK